MIVLDSRGQNGRQRRCHSPSPMLRSVERLRLLDDPPRNVDVSGRSASCVWVLVWSADVFQEDRCLHKVVASVSGRPCTRWAGLRWTGLDGTGWGLDGDWMGLDGTGWDWVDGTAVTALDGTSSLHGTGLLHCTPHGTSLALALRNVSDVMIVHDASVSHLTSPHLTSSHLTSFAGRTVAAG